MTSNQINARKDIRETTIALNELKEKKRSNRARENIETGKLAMEGLKTGISAIGTAGKLVGTSNSPDWYNLDKQLVSDVASLSYETPLGSEVQFPTVEETAPVIGADLPGSRAINGATKFIPGVMALRYIPTIGNTAGIGSPINIAAKNIYSFIRHANSGSKNYEAVDYMMYVNYIISLHTIFHNMCRLYSLVRTYKVENKYYPVGILKAMGYSDAMIDEISNNLSQFRASINEFALSLNRFAVPASWPTYSRNAWLNLNYFKDMAIKKSQIYIFEPLTYYHFDALHGWLIGHDFDENFKSTFGVLQLELKVLIREALSIEDVGIMTGDTIKAFGESGLVRVGEIPKDFHIESTYSPEVLSQIASANVVGSLGIDDTTRALIRRLSTLSSSIWQTTEETPEVSGYTMGTIYQGIPLGYATSTVDSYQQSNPGIICDATIMSYGDQINATNYGLRTILHTYGFGHMYKDNPSPDDNMVMTRLMATDGLGTLTHRTIATDTLTTFNIRRTKECGSEVIMFVTISVFDEYGSVLTYSMSDGSSQVTNIEDITQDIQGVTALMALEYVHGLYDFLKSKFDWAPRLRTLSSYYRSQYEGAAVTYLGATLMDDIADAANYIKIEESVLHHIHWVAMASLYDIPRLLTSRSR